MEKRAGVAGKSPSDPDADLATCDGREKKGGLGRKSSSAGSSEVSVQLMESLRRRFCLKKPMLGKDNQLGVPYHAQLGQESMVPGLNTGGS